MIRPKHHSGFNFNIFVEDLSPKYIPLLILAAGCLAALPYLFLANGEVNLLPLIAAAILLPVIGFALHLVKQIWGATGMFWIVAIYALIPVLLHGLAHLTGFFGLNATSAFLHYWRWAGLIVPHLVALAYLAGTVTLHKVINR
jgi:hypothetical protein